MNLSFNFLLKEFKFLLKSLMINKYESVFPCFFFFQIPVLQATNFQFFIEKNEVLNILINTLKFHLKSLFHLLMKVFELIINIQNNY